MTDRPADLADYAAHHGELTRTLLDLGRAIFQAFAVLHAIRFDAPWLRRRV